MFHKLTFDNIQKIVEMASHLRQDVSSTAFLLMKALIFCALLCGNLSSLLKFGGSWNDRLDDPLCIRM